MDLRISRYSVPSKAQARLPGRIVAGLLLLIECALCVSVRGQAERSLCRDGFGSFSTEFLSGVTVSVGASKNGAFAAHACDVTLKWGKQTLPVARGVWEADVDVLGADLGLGVPVVAFRIKNTELDHLSSYEVYSLVKAPRLLRTITGGDTYDAKDANLRGRNEIWTDDARAVDGFEGLPLSSWDFVPLLVVQFEDQKLVNASAEFLAYFDAQIAQVRSQLDLKVLDQFRKSDGRVSASTTPALADLHLLVRTKIRVLEIVLSYLDSGRDERAWSELAAMWPPADLSRIQRAIQEARARGVLRQVDTTAQPEGRSRWRHRAHVFDCIKSDKYENGSDASSIAGHGGLVPGVAEMNPAPVDSRPMPIYLGMNYARSQEEGVPVANVKIYLNLVVDAAGKVRFANLENKADSGPVASKILDAAADWNFIPAFVGKRPVACRMRYGVWPKQ